MAKRPDGGPSRPRLFALIPLGFVILVAVLVIFGFWRSETSEIGPTDAAEEQAEEALDGEIDAEFD